MGKAFSIVLALWYFADAILYWFGHRQPPTTIEAGFYCALIAICFAADAASET